MTDGEAEMSPWSNLRALFVNCSLEADAARSHTRLLMERSAGIMREAGAAVDTIHALDHQIPFGMASDMTEHGYDVDAWPELQRRIDQSDILVLGTPIWLGQKSSVATLVIERMYAGSGGTNAKGQYRYYGKTAGCVVTGNEDGVKACAQDILYCLGHIGYSIPPQADCGWLGEIGPGPSYGDVPANGPAGAGPAGYDSDFTNRNTTIMTWNLLHTAKMLRDAGGLPAHGNVPAAWTEVPNAADQDPARL